jgi:hypothetical protein
MEETEDTIIIRKKDIGRLIIYSLSGVAVTIFGLVELPMVTSWGAAHNITAPGTPILYGMLYLMVLQFAAIAVFIGVVLFDLGQAKYRLVKLEETLIKEIREVNHLDENLP